MKARDFCKVCKKLANEERLDILRRVMMATAEEGVSVGQIADIVRIGQPATSAYLAQLQDDCGLVSSVRQGRYCIYRALPDRSDERLVRLFIALQKYFRAESSGFAFINGLRPSAPSFLLILPTLSNPSRVKLLQVVRSEKRTSKNHLMTVTGFSELNVRRHLSSLFDCGLVEGDLSNVVWKEPYDELSRLFIDLSIS